MHCSQVCNADNMASAVCVRAPPAKSRVAKSLEAAREAGAAAFAYGAFIMAVINFLIIAFVVFQLVRSVNRIKDAAKKEEEATAPVEEAPAGPSEIELLTEIRDSLAKS